MDEVYGDVESACACACRRSAGKCRQVTGQDKNYMKFWNPLVLVDGPSRIVLAPPH